MFKNESVKYATKGANAKIRIRTLLYFWAILFNFKY